MPTLTHLLFLSQDVQQKVKPYVTSLDMSRFNYDDFIRVLAIINRYTDFIRVLAIINRYTDFIRVLAIINRYTYSAVQPWAVILCSFLEGFSL